jgi:hypothetical protein
VDKKKAFHDGKKLMPSVMTAYFGQTCFLSISQHRPEMPSRVVFCTSRCCRFVPVCMHNKLAECGAGFAPAGMARWVYIVGGFLDISMWFARTNVCGRIRPFKGKTFTQICYAYALQQYYLYIISKKLLFCLICSDRFLSSLCCRHICNKGGVQQYFTCKHVESI